MSDIVKGQGLQNLDVIGAEESGSRGSSAVVLDFGQRDVVALDCAGDRSSVPAPSRKGRPMNRLNRFLAALLMLCLTSGAGAFSGTVAAIARNGKVAYLRAVGFRDNAKTTPLKEDAIFWIASMTKPVTSVAAMMLVEEGKLDLAAPVYQYLPELKDMMVGVETKDPVTGATELKREPQKRPMTVEDLLRHTAGLDLRREDNKVIDGVFRPGKTLADYVSALAKLSLAHQPGEVSAYSSSFNVLGRVIEVASDQPLDQFLENRLFKPLGMVDTGFWVPPEKLSRLIDRPGSLRPVMSDVTKPITLFSGSGGLVLTAADYLRFCQMLLNGGELDGVRILKAATVRRMTTNALPPDIRFAGDFLMGPEAGSTWGLGFAVRNDPDRSLVVPGSVGSFSWSGISGTYFWVDPGEQLIAVQLIQVAPTTGGPLEQIFRDLTYGALSVPGRSVAALAAAPVTIDAATLGTYAGTYAFYSISSRDQQEPFGGLGIAVGMEDGRAKVVSTLPQMPAPRPASWPTTSSPMSMPSRCKASASTRSSRRCAGRPAARPACGSCARGRTGRSRCRSSAPRSGVAQADLQVAVKDGRLMVGASGKLPILNFDLGALVAVTAVSANEFMVDGGDHTRLAFERDDVGKPARLVLNPGPWQITGQRIN
jgi:CubicO group peptidase (beta-lactamase class C family)